MKHLEHEASDLNPSLKKRTALVYYALHLHSNTTWMLSYAIHIWAGRLIYSSLNPVRMGKQFDLKGLYNNRGKTRMQHTTTC